MVIRLLIIPAVILAIYTLFDLFSSDTRRRAGLSPLLWVLIILLIPVLGPITWIIISRSGQRPGAPSRSGPYGPSATTGRAPRSGQRAPDDDPEFLWRLQQQQRRMQQQRKNTAAAPPDNTADTSNQEGGSRHEKSPDHPEGRRGEASDNDESSADDQGESR